MKSRAEPSLHRRHHHHAISAASGARPDPHVSVVTYLGWRGFCCEGKGQPMVVMMTMTMTSDDDDDDHDDDDDDDKLVKLAKFEVKQID